MGAIFLTKKGDAARQGQSGATCRVPGGKVWGVDAGVGGGENNLGFGYLEIRVKLAQEYVYYTIHDI